MLSTVRGELGIAGATGVEGPGLEWTIGILYVSRGPLAGQASPTGKARNILGADRAEGTRHRISRRSRAPLRHESEEVVP
ncbi:MAG: hypothetical protein AB1486_33495 [Planctomycetota bacterium]